MSTSPFTILKVSGKEVPIVEPNSKPLSMVASESIKKKFLKITKNYEAIKASANFTAKSKPMLLSKIPHDKKKP